MAAKISIMNSAKKYPSGMTINTVSLPIEPGSCYPLPELSDIGKTPMLRWFLSFVDPIEMEIILEETLIFSSIIELSVSSGQRNPGLVFKHFALGKGMYASRIMTSAREYLAYFAMQPGSYTINIAKKVVNELNLRKMVISKVKMVQKIWQLVMKKFSILIAMPVAI